MKDLAVAREAQQAAKIRQLADMARVEHQEFQRVVDANRAKEEEERHQVTQKCRIKETRIALGATVYCIIS